MYSSLNLTELVIPTQISDQLQNTISNNSTKHYEINVINFTNPFRLVNRALNKSLVEREMLSYIYVNNVLNNTVGKTLVYAKCE